MLAALGALGLVFAFAWVARDLPDPHRVNDRFLAQSTKIYDRKGETVLYDIHGDKKRTVVKFDQIPDAVRQATIVAEDRDFYHHKGFDLRGILRAIFRNTVHLDPRGEGGSTITQQFIKNSVLTPKKTYTRKIKELILAYQIERRFTKDQILELYLNEIPYGTNAYGVEAAAQTYFGKSSKDLTLAEAAILAALPRAPTYYSPYGNNTDALYGRQQFILDGMVEEEYITKDQAEAAKAETLKFNEHREPILAPHFVFYVRELLTEKYGESAVEQGGLKVITTLDMGHQKAAEDAIAQYGERNQKQYNASNAAFVSLDTKTGQVLAMVGSRDYFDTEHSGNVNVALRPRQPGSSLKPIVYASAFERGYTPETMVFDLVTNFGAGGTSYTPHNYDNKEHGPVSLRQALAGSLNIPAVKVLYLTGVNYVLDVAERFGYTTFGDRSRFGLSLVLGGGEVRLLDHVSAFATLAREGVRHPVTPILRVEDKNGKALEEYVKKEARIMDAEVVRKVTSILTDNNARSFIFGSRTPLILPDRPVAAKTGTTNDFHDAWTLGYTPSLAAGVWVGNNNNDEMRRGSDGVVVAAPIWNAYMRKVLGGTAVETFKAPVADKADKPMLNGKVGVAHKLPVDKDSGRVIPESCRDTYPQQYVTMKDFKEVHTILYWVDKTSPRGAAPQDPKKDPQFAAWEAPVRKWAEANRYPNLARLPQERCDRRTAEQAPVVTITSPAAGTAVSSAASVFSASVAATNPVGAVAFAIDGVIVGTLSEPPYSFSYENGVFENGEHTLTVTATDAEGNVGTATAQFSYALPDGARKLSILSPQPNAVFQAQDFPLEVRVFVFEPNGVRSVELLSAGAVVDVVSGPASGALVLHAPSLPPGNQVLDVRATGAAGSTTLSLPLTVQ